MLKYAIVVLVAACVSAGVLPYSSLYAGYSAPLGQATSYQYVIKYDQPVGIKPLGGYAPAISYADAVIPEAVSYVTAPTLTYATGRSLGLGYADVDYGYGGGPAGQVAVW